MEILFYVLSGFIILCIIGNLVKEIIYGDEIPGWDPESLE